MSSRKLRVQLSKLLKERGYGKLYTCPRSNAFKWLSSSKLRDMINFLTIVKPGDIVYEWGCNHIVAKEPEVLWNQAGIYGRLKRGGVYCGIDQVEYTDGSYSCGCGSYECFTYDNKPRTKQEIVASLEKQKNSEWGSFAKDYFKLLEMGHDLIDDNGFRVHNYNELYRLLK